MATIVPCFLAEYEGLFRLFQVYQIKMKTQTCIVKVVLGRTRHFFTGRILRIKKMQIVAQKHGRIISFQTNLN